MSPIYILSILICVTFAEEVNIARIKHKFHKKNLILGRLQQNDAIVQGKRGSKRHGIPRIYGQKETDESYEVVFGRLHHGNTWSR